MCINIYSYTEYWFCIIFKTWWAWRSSLPFSFDLHFQKDTQMANKQWKDVNHWSLRKCKSKNYWEILLHTSCFKQNNTNPILFSHKRNRVLIHTITSMNFQNTMQSERSQTLMVTYYIFCSYRIYHTQNMQIHRDRKQIRGYQGMG